jgi:Uma2 family endonuclease
MAEPVYYTAEMVRAIPDDGKRYELVYGELLVTPSPRLIHQAVVSRLLVSLDAYLATYRIGVVLTSPADISWSADTLVQPDVFVADRDEARTLEWSYVKTLLLAIEVLSPSTGRFDRFTKRRLYQEIGIPTYWIVDPDREVVEVWTPNDTQPTVHRDRVIWTPNAADEPLTIELTELFKEI